LRYLSPLRTTLCYRWFEQELHAFLLLEVFRSESWDEILLRGEVVAPQVFISRSTMTMDVSTYVDENIGSYGLIIFGSHEFNISFIFIYLDSSKSFMRFETYLLCELSSLVLILKINRLREFGSSTRSCNFCPK
jgi:hypothetical protein